MSGVQSSTVGQARCAYLRACRLDVEVRKPGNVSLDSPGHGMQAEQFIASAEASAGPLFMAGARVGERIERAVDASWAVAGCNTNLGIVLLCAPLAAALETDGAGRDAGALRAAIREVIERLDVDDARAAFRAIGRANPAGLGQVAVQDVRAEPTIDLGRAMALAAGRDRIAHQYTIGFADLFDLLAVQGNVPDAPTAASVQRVFLECLARWPDSHIVRKHGGAVAQTVMSAAQHWRGHPSPGMAPGFAAWDDALKARGINPGTSADLTVATLLLAGLLAPPEARWHRS